MTLHLRPWPRVAGREAGRQRTQFVLRLGGTKSSCHQGRAHLDLNLGHLGGNGELGAPGLDQVLWMEELDDVCSPSCHIPHGAGCMERDRRCFLWMENKAAKSHLWPPGCACNQGVELQRFPVQQHYEEMD